MSHPETPSIDGSNFEILKSASLSDSEIGELFNWYCDIRQDGESLSRVMIRHGFYQSSAERTIELIQRGFMTGISPAAVFSNEGIEKLRQTVIGKTLTTLLTNPARPKDSHSTQPQFVTTPPPVIKPKPKPSFPQVGETLGRCLLTGILGKGGFGTVFSALHTTLNMPVAVKVLCNKDRLEENVKELMTREARVLAQINHPSIVRVLDFENTEMPYFVMEYVEGPSLADLIRQTGRLSLERTIEIALQVIDGLAEAWKSGIVHRDIKPGNILLTKSGQVKIADVGLAQVPGYDDSSLTPDPNRPIGTCAYIAPEQIRNLGTVDFRADIYALGCTLYHALTGQIPFNGKTQREVIMKHLMAEPEVPTTIAPENVSPAASLVLLKMMRKNPEERFSTYEELAQALLTLVKPKPVNVTDHDIQMTKIESDSPTKKSLTKRFGQWLTRRSAPPPN